MQERVKWQDYFLSLCFYIAARSHDLNTQCGAILVNHNNQILSTGYNGFVRGIPNDILPTTRPAKYDYMIHAEINAVLNCPTSCENSNIYITCRPCLQCLQYLIQAGIKKVYYTPFGTAKMTQGEAYHKKWTDFVNEVELAQLIELHEVTPNFSWLNGPTEKIKNFIKR